MAVFRVPGSIGRHATTQNIEDGTLCRAASPRPGPSNSKRKIGHATSTPSPQPNKPNATPTRPLLSRKKPAALPVLRERIQGEQVRKLQQLLNSRVAPYPNLAVDGIFGPLTRAAVETFQRRQKITSDGVVGPQTWYFLHKNEPAKPQAPAASSAQPTATTPTIAQPVAASVAKRVIWEWTLEEKFLDVLKRVPSRLKPQLRKEWEAMIQWESVVISLLIIAGFCFLSGGTALILGWVLLGADTSMALASAIMIASRAGTEKELDEAADELAHVVITLGVAKFFHSVGKAAGKLRGGKPPKATEATTSEKPAGRRATAKESPAKSQEPKKESPKSPKQPQKPPVLKSVSPTEIELAASAGDSPAQIAARQKVSRAFYEEHTNWDANRIDNHLDGIDYSKPVKARTSPPPETVVHWQVPNGKKGPYFADPGTSPSELGIGPLGTAPGPKPAPVVEKVATSYPMAPETPLLESTAAPIKDTWSVAGGGAAGAPGTMGYGGIKQSAKGGGTQYFAPSQSSTTSL